MKNAIFFLLLILIIGNVSGFTIPGKFNIEGETQSGETQDSRGNTGGNGGSRIVNETPEICEENWKCENFGDCSDGIKNKTCIDLNNCSPKKTEFSKCFSFGDFVIKPFGIEIEKKGIFLGIYCVWWYIILSGVVVVLLSVIFFLVFRKKKKRKIRKR